MKESEFEQYLLELDKDNITSEDVLILALYDDVEPLILQRRVHKLQDRARELGVPVKRVDECLAALKNGLEQSAKKDKPAPCAFDGITISAVKQALNNLGITIQYNQLLKELEVHGLPEYYSSGNAANILPAYLKDYFKSQGVKGAARDTIIDYLECIADENRYNPLKDFFAVERWDGVNRFTELYKILGVTDSRYKDYIRKWMIQCVALGLNDEDNPVGAEGVLVLQGPQGLAKTSFFRILSPFPKWFVEGAVIDLRDKDSLIKAVGGFITELGELESTLKRDQPALKAFITSPQDKIRAPYARTAPTVPRRTSFCGTVNPKDYLRDNTGSRRFWTVPVTNIDKKTLFSLPRAWINQLWFQVYSLYCEDHNGFRLTDTEIKELQEANRQYEVTLPFEIEIMEKLDFSLPVEQWEWWKASEVKSVIVGNVSAVQVGKVLSKNLKSIRGDDGEVESPLIPFKNPRISRGYPEYFIPLKHSDYRW